MTSGPRRRLLADFVDWVSAEEVAWLRRLAGHSGTWPLNPFLRDQKTAELLMQRGFVEIVQPPVPYLPYAGITKAGRAALDAHNAGHVRPRKMPDVDRHRVRETRVRVSS